MKSTLSDTLYAQLRDEIITGALPVGEPLLEQGIAQRFGVSKVTAREILQRLCSGNYLASYPRKGYLIQEITPRQCKQIQQVRYQVEAFALREIIRLCSDEEIQSLAAILGEEVRGHDPYSTVNSRFHLKIAQLTGSKYVYDTMYAFIGMVCRYALMNAAQGRFGREDSHHPQIVQALLFRDGQAALEHLRMDLHLQPDDI